MISDAHTNSQVTHSNEQTRRNYDRLSPIYDLLTGRFEQKFNRRLLDLLHIAEAETILEIGFGTGHSLLRAAQLVGEKGKVYGIDLSPRMLAASQRRLEQAGLWDRLELTCADATRLPYPANMFDAVYMSFTLELFDNPEMSMLLAGTRHVLKRGGRLGVLSMSKGSDPTVLMSIYSWLNKIFPQIIDCRPIDVEQSIQEAGFGIQFQEQLNLSGLPAEIVIGQKEYA